jgi:hypothetical protein
MLSLTYYTSRRRDMYEYDFDERTNFEKDLDAQYELNRYSNSPWLTPCTTCDGTGDGGGVWDDELMCYHAWVCGKCLGTGQVTDPDYKWED